MGVPSKQGKLSTLAHPSFYHQIGRYRSRPVDDSRFLALTLCWTGRLHTNPIRSRILRRSPVDPSSSGALAKDPSSTSPRAAVDIEGGDTVDGEVVTERIVLVPKLALQPKLAPGLSNRVKEVDLVCHRLVLEVFLGHQNHSLNFHLLYGWYSATLQDFFFDRRRLKSRSHQNQRNTNPD